MVKRMIMLCAGALVLSTFIAAPAHAQGRWRGGDPVISEVYVNLGDPADPNGFGTLTIRGRNLVGRLNRDETLVMLGEQGPLEILGEPTDNEIKVTCFADHSLSDPPQDNFQCSAGDYRLKLAVVRVDRRWRRHHHDFERVATYDLTIGSAASDQPQDSPDVELLKRQLMLTRNALCDLTENVRNALSSNDPPINIDPIVPDAMCGG